MGLAGLAAFLYVRRSHNTAKQGHTEARTSTLAACVHCCLELLP